MSIQAIEAVKASSLQRTKRLLAYEFATYANKNGENIFPAITTISGILGTSRQTLHKHIAELVNTGVIEPVGKSRKGIKRYRFTQSFMDTSLVSTEATQAVVSTEATQGVKPFDKGCKATTQGVSNSFTPLVSPQLTQTPINTLINTSINTVNNTPNKFENNSSSKWCDVAAVLESIRTARDRQFNTDGLNAFTLECVKMTGGWSHLRNLTAQQITSELHNARKVLS